MGQRQYIDNQSAEKPELLADQPVVISEIFTFQGRRCRCRQVADFCLQTVITASGEKQRYYRALVPQRPATHDDFYPQRVIDAG